MKDFAKHFYKSKAWERCRLAFLRSKFFLCERCGGPATIAHHKIWLNEKNINDPTISLSWDNFEALCQDCHNKVHHCDPNVLREGLAFDKDGNIVQVQDPDDE